MDRDELRDEIAGWFFKNVDCKDPHYFPADKARYWADSILSLLAPVLADAGKWDALTKKYPHFCTRFDPEIDGEVKDETK